MDRDEAQRRDSLMTFVRGHRRFVEVLRDTVAGMELPETEAALKVVDDIFGALDRLAEIVHGDLSEQFERVMLEPSRTDLRTAVVEAGVGGVVTEHLYRVGDLDTPTHDYQVLKINRCSVRLRSQRSLSEELVQFAAGWRSGGDDWSVSQAVPWPGREKYQADLAKAEAEAAQREAEWKAKMRAATQGTAMEWPEEG